MDKVHAIRTRMKPARLLTHAASLTACLLLCCCVGFCQIPETWQPVPKEDLALKENPANPGSAAMILDRAVYTDDERRLQTEWIRIKILTEAGKAYADVQIPYLERSTTIEEIRARTVRADGTVVPFSGTIFDKPLIRYKRFRYEAKTFTLPGVELGSVIEYVYTMHWKNKLPDYVRNPSGYVFQEGWTVPSTTWILQQSLFTRHAIFVLRPVKAGRLVWTKVRLADNGPSSQADGTVRMEIANIPALEQEDYMPPEPMLTSRVHLFYQVGNFTNYWSGWGRVRFQFAEKFIEKTKFLEREANVIAPGTQLDEGRLRKIYARTQQIRNLSYEDNKTDKELKREGIAGNKNAEDVYRHNYGYGMEINYLFTALSRAAGFDATVAQVVSRDSAVFDPQLPDGSQLNEMVVEVHVSGKSLYLDPSCRVCNFGLLPWYETNAYGVRWDKAGGEIIQTPGDGDPSTVQRTADLHLQPDGSLDGRVVVNFTKHEATGLRKPAMDADEAGRKKLIEDTLKAWLPAGTRIDIEAIGPWDDVEQPLQVQAHVHAARFASLSPKRILFPISVFQGGASPLFTQVYRRQPVYFQSSYSGVDTITVSVPDGYQVEALPSEVNYERAEGAFHFKWTSNSGTMRLERHTVRNGYYFPIDSYPALRQYYEELRQQDAQNIVLHRLEGGQAH